MNQPIELNPGQEPPLCVDLDGTLIRGDSLLVSLSQLLRRAPWQVVPLAAALAGGRPSFKAAVAARWVPKPDSLQYRTAVVEFIREQRHAGRRIVLATAAHRDLAEAVAAHLGLFDDVIASDLSVNCKSEVKVRAIRQHLGSGEFDYIGDSLADLPVFAAARRGYLVAPKPDLLARARAAGRIVQVFPG